MIPVLLGALLAIGAAYGTGCALARRLDVSAASRFVSGAAALSILLFALMAAGVSYRPVLIGVGAVASLGILLRRPEFQRPQMPVWAVVIVVAFGAWYVVNAMAPEVETDPNSYHLIQARATHFEREVTFYGSLPHATELLFGVAYAVGGAPAAKLVHLAFLMASVPLIVSIARGFALSEDVAWGSAVMYFAAPVVGMAGSAAFNDAALVAGFLVVAETLQRGGPASFAGLSAGFCYAVKMTGGLAAPAGLGVLLVRRRWRDALVFSVAAAVVILPWMIRNAVTTGNPLAPFFNALFPNPHFTKAMEQELSAFLATYGMGFGDRLRHVLWGWRLHGILGPAFILAPLALLGLRERRQWVLIGLTAVLALPWAFNAGARFLMPALPFVAMAMLAPLPRVAVLGIVMLHAATSWPHVMDIYDPQTLRVKRFPIAVAVGLESAHEYLDRESWDYRVAKLVESHTTASDQILDFHGVHAALLNRQLVGWWQTARGRRAFTTVNATYQPGEHRINEVRAEFGLQPLKAVRLRKLNAAPMWWIPEVEFFQGPILHANRAQWSLESDANQWELPLAFDRNTASMWASGEVARPGMQVTIDFNGTETLSAVRVIGIAIAIDVQRQDGTWVSVPTKERDLGPADLRPQARAALKQLGFTHIVASAGYEGTGNIGYRLANDAPAWGLKLLGEFDTVFVFRIP